VKTLVGFHAVTSRLRQKPDTIGEIYVDATRNDGRAKDLRKLAEGVGVRVIPVDTKRLDGMAGGTRHQGVVAQAQPLDMPQFIEDVLEGLAEPPLLLLLDGVQDPHNLGACLRTADAAGVDAVIVPRHGAARLGPTVSKVAAGAAEALPFATVSNPGRVLDWLGEYGVRRIGTSGDAEAELWSLDLAGPLALVMGREETGLSAAVRRRCDGLARLPMAGSVASLNVSVATGICLFEALRQRRSRLAATGRSG
jgi:23S rRNA (guanosine2251-2'-O)-methyltransferase